MNLKLEKERLNEEKYKTIYNKTFKIAAILLKHFLNKRRNKNNNNINKK